MQLSRICNSDTTRIQEKTGDVKAQSFPALLCPPILQQKICPDTTNTDAKDDFMTDAILDAVLDTLKTLPFLYVVYLLILFLQSRVNIGLIVGKSERKYGPILGAILGSIPQCGFSAACAELYGAGVIGAGTLISVFLATSDEAVPVLLSHPGQFPQVVLLLGCKLVIAILFGYLLTHTVFRREAAAMLQQDLYDEEEYAAQEYEKYLAEQNRQDNETPSVSNGTENTDSSEATSAPSISCGCGRCSSNLFVSSLYHTLRTGVFIGITMILINLLLFWLGEDSLATLLLSGSILQPFITALIGLIPGCAISVMLVELFLSGSITFGAAVAGLSTGAGFGYLILFGRCSNKKKSLQIVVCTYLCAVISGVLIQLFM